MPSYKIVILLFKVGVGGGGEENTFFLLAIFESNMLLKTSINV